jgi:chemotaxis protein methyltransferase CheR
MDQGEFPLSEREFSRIRDRVYRAAGISLSDAKRTLVVARLAKIVRTGGFGGFDAYMDELERTENPEDAQAFINALTTNLTRFWREEHHFDQLIAQVGGIVEMRRRATDTKRLRIWSAGCSTGQEPYTIALSLLAALPELKQWDFKILATDIDTSVLDKAATGIYPTGELQGLSTERVRLFERIAGEQVVVPKAVREIVSFKPLNLLAPNWPMKGQFEAIFCRNVIIYFDRPTQSEVIGRLAKVLVPGGMLYVGHSENLGAHGTSFRLVGKTVYQARVHQKAKDAA